MVTRSETASFVLQISLGEDADAEELDRLTRQLRNELRDVSGVEGAELVRGEPAPQGAKAVDPVTLGALALVILPTVLPKLVEFLQAWVLRGQGRAIKFKGDINGRQIEFEGEAKELKALLVTLAGASKQADVPE
jgi:hypothetical protein